LKADKITNVTRPRFYAPDLDPSRAETILSADESHHLVRVMRLVAGDELLAFDGQGHEYEAHVVRADRRAAAIALDAEVASTAAPRIPTTLVQAVLKGDKMDGVIRDATMAGAAVIAPVVTERSLVGLSALARGHALERWQRVAVASAKQCGRARLPIIQAPRPFTAWLDASFEGLRVLLAEPSGDTEQIASLRTVLSSAVAPSVACVVGPEGGWSAGERQLAASAGCIPASLGRMTFRADAVGLVAVSLVNFTFDD
jgi:16S rRNA (uracil1498-N3)-methyltransferase